MIFDEFKYALLLGSILLGWIKVGHLSNSGQG